MVSNDECGSLLTCEVCSGPVWLRGWLVVGLLLCVAPGELLATAARSSGVVTSLALRTIYVRYPQHRFQAKDRIVVKRRGRVIGVWQVQAVSSMYLSATYVSGSRKVQVGDRVVGRGSRKEQAETAKVEATELSPLQQQQLWAGVQKTIGQQIKFREQPLALRSSASPTEISYDATVQYLGAFSRGGSFQTMMFQSRMLVEQFLGTGLWHRHLLRVRYDFSRDRYPWGDRFRPILEVYQLSVGYRLRAFDVGLGRLARIPSEAGVVDGIRLEGKPVSWLSIIGYGGLAPDERDLAIRVDAFRYGVTLQANTYRWHRYSQLGFSGQIFQGQLDRHFVFAETFLQPATWMELFGRGVVEVVVPANSFSRTAPELTSATADIRVFPLRWLQASARYDYYRPALNLNWLQDMQDALPVDAFKEYFVGEPRHSVRGSVELSYHKQAMRGGVSFDYLLNEGSRWVASGWFSWYQIFRLPLRLYGRYSYLASPDFLQGHMASVTIGSSWPSWLSVSLGYRIDAYLLPQDFWQLEHTARANLYFNLPLGFYINVSGQIRFGEIDQGIFIFSQLGWRLTK